MGLHAGPLQGRTVFLRRRWWWRLHGGRFVLRRRRPVGWTVILRGRRLDRRFILGQWWIHRSPVIPPGRWFRRRTVIPSRRSIDGRTVIRPAGPVIWPAGPVHGRTIIRRTRSIDRWPSLPLTGLNNVCQVIRLPDRDRVDPERVRFVTQVRVRFLSGKEPGHVLQFGVQRDFLSGLLHLDDEQPVRADLRCSQPQL